MLGLNHAILERSQNVCVRGYLTDGDAAMLHSTLFKDHRWTFETIPPPPSSLSQAIFANQLYDVVFRIHVILGPSTIEDDNTWMGHCPDRSCCDKKIDYEQVELRLLDSRMYMPTLSMHEVKSRPLVGRKFGCSLWADFFYICYSRWMLNTRSVSTFIVISVIYVFQQ